MNKVEAQDHNFTPLPHLLENCIKLYDSPLFQKGATVESTFAALFGAQSSCCERFHSLRSDKDLRFQPPQPLVAEGAPWGAVNTLTCRVSVPVLGMCKYEEVNRFVLCRDQEQMTLAVQRLGKLRAGLYGTVPAELLYLFTQTDKADKIHMQVFAVCPTGRFAGAALASYYKSIQDFCTVAREVMQEWGKNCSSVKTGQHKHSDKDQHILSKTNVPKDDATESIFPLLDYQIF
jgi:hypothetical protein